MIRVLVVDDSQVLRDFLVHLFRKDPEMVLVGTCSNGKEAVEAVNHWKPDVITMDINMPVMDGLEATKLIMETNPTPIVIVSGIWDPKEVATTFRAMEVGALAIVQKPAGFGHPDHETMTADLLKKVKLMSEVKVIRRFPHLQRKGPLPQIKDLSGVKPLPSKSDVRIVAMGASTGGPVVLQKIFAGLPGDFPVPILVVQHIATGFTQGLCDWLDQSSDLVVSIPAPGEVPLPGHVYVAPEESHMEVERSGRLMFSEAEPENGLRPSVSHLFRSVGEVYGKHTAGVLLTGMGKDGSEELKLLKDKGALTIAQDKESSVVSGMPGEAIKLGGATYVLPPDKIIYTLIGLFRENEGGKRQSLAGQKAMQN